MPRVSASPPIPFLAHKLCAWFRSHARDLPWRRTKDPYKIWISEIMLQQTQVQTVIPYYEKWMKRFPTIQDLARAPLSEAIKYWAGLGYYRRVRAIHETARILCKSLPARIGVPANHSELLQSGQQSISGQDPSRRSAGKSSTRDGRMKATAPLFPDTVGKLVQLPGIGRYTAGAIASMAFGRPVPVLDGNVKRVLSRLFAIREAIDTAAGERKLWKLAERLVMANSRRGASQLRCLSWRDNATAAVEAISNRRLLRRSFRTPRKDGAKDGIKGDTTNSLHPGELNQALMELGATVCVPQNPLCLVCPLNAHCKAYQCFQPRDFPRRAHRSTIKTLTTAAAIIRANNRILIQQQPQKGRWGGLWTFPYWQSKEEMLKSLGQIKKNLKKCMTITHSFTHYRIHLEVFEWQRHNPKKTGIQTKPPRRLRWVTPVNLKHYAFPSPHQKIVNYLLEDDGSKTTPRQQSVSVS